jgi:hypothetical protein
MAGGAQHKSFMSVGTLHHELNNWVTFDFEQSLHETNACPDRLVPCRCSTASRLAPGDLRSEGGTSLRSSCTRSAGRHAASISVPQKSHAAAVSSD